MKPGGGGAGGCWRQLVGRRVVCGISDVGRVG